MNDGPGFVWYEYYILFYKRKPMDWYKKPVYLDLDYINKQWMDSQVWGTIVPLKFKKYVKFYKNFINFINIFV